MFLARARLVSLVFWLVLLCTAQKRAWGLVQSQAPRCVQDALVYWDSSVIKRSRELVQAGVHLALWYCAKADSSLHKRFLIEDPLPKIQEEFNQAVLANEAHSPPYYFWLRRAALSENQYAEVFWPVVQLVAARFWKEHFPDSYLVWNDDSLLSVQRLEFRHGDLHGVAEFQKGVFVSVSPSPAEFAKLLVHERLHAARLSDAGGGGCAEQHVENWTLQRFWLNGVVEELMVQEVSDLVMAVVQKRKSRWSVDGALPNLVHRVAQVLAQNQRRCESCVEGANAAELAWNSHVEFMSTLSWDVQYESWRPELYRSRNRLQLLLQK